MNSVAARSVAVVAARTGGSESSAAQRTTLSRTPKSTAHDDRQHGAEHVPVLRPRPFAGKSHPSRHDEQRAGDKACANGLAEQADCQERGEERRGADEDRGTRRPRPSYRLGEQDLRQARHEQSDQEEGPQGLVQQIRELACSPR